MTEREYRNRVRGCWLGKNIGGTFGMPFEWIRQFNDVKIYAQDLNGKPAPNDDLDLQLLALIAMEDLGENVTREQLAHYWSLFVTPHWAEYGNAKANMKLGIAPPYSGEYNNIYRDSCGSYIRSELWACLYAGDPRGAAEAMMRDSGIDHGVRSEGNYAAVFVAAMQSAAFLSGNIRKLIGIGLSYIPSDCGVARAIALVCEMYDAGRDFKDCRNAVLEHFRSHPFLVRDEGGVRMAICEEDVARGFDNGPVGYDAPDNVAMIVLGLLYGEGDFDRTMYYTVACGEDTDCTAATAGALFGIMNGAEGFDRKWLDPIGETIVTCSLNHGEMNGIPGRIPADIGELTDRTVAMKNKLGWKTCENPYADADFLERLYDGSIFRSFPFFDVRVRFPEGIYLKEGQSLPVEAELTNKSLASENFTFTWMTDGGAKFSPGCASVYVPRDVYGNPCVTARFALSADDARGAAVRAVLQITVVGKSEVQCVPVIFIKTA